MSASFAEIAVTTNFSFLRGASHPKELVAAAAFHGHVAIGIADRNTLAGVVRAYEGLNEIREKTGKTTKLLVGARLVFVDGTPDILAYPADRPAYGRLCRLLSAGKQRAAKGECILTLDDLLEWQEGLLLVIMPSHPAREEAGGDPFKKSWNTEDVAPAPRLSSPNVGEVARRAGGGRGCARRPPPPRCARHLPHVGGGNVNLPYDRSLAIPPRVGRAR